MRAPSAPSNWMNVARAKHVAFLLVALTEFRFPAVVESFQQLSVERYNLQQLKKAIPCRKPSNFRVSRRFLGEVSLSRVSADVTRPAQSITALADGSAKGYSDMQPYPYFDFESSAEAAYVSPAVPTSEMFKIIQAEANALIDDSILSGQLRRHVFSHQSLISCISSILARKLSCDDLNEEVLMDLFTKILETHPKLVTDMVHDLLWIRKVDPATIGYLQPLLFFKGFHAIQVQRMTHVLWATNNLKKKMTALALQSRVSEVFGVDAHPGARISHSVMLDHASGIVIGETAAIGHSCYILHGVTLGATGKSGAFDRHPKVRNNVKIGAGAMILGNIALEDGVVVGAGAIVTISVSKGETVVGINRLLSSSQKQAPQNNTVSSESWAFIV